MLCAWLYSTWDGVCNLSLDYIYLSYTDAVAAELGLTGGKQSAKQKGLLVHSVLLLDAEHEHTVGLIAQRIGAGRNVGGRGNLAD
jgi:hypothetical protein